MSNIYIPEGTEPGGRDTVHQLSLKLAEYCIENLFVDPEGFTVTNGNTIKVGDSGQRILQKILGAAQGGLFLTAPHTHAIADVTGLQANLTSIEDDVDAIEARDWVEVADDSIASTESPASWQDGAVSVMAVTILGDYPEGTGVVVIDRRTQFPSRTYTVTSGSVYSSSYGFVWSAWVKHTTSEAGVISDDLEFSGKLKLSGLTEYADDTAAGVGGLVAGDIYTTTGSLKIKL